MGKKIKTCIECGSSFSGRRKSRCCSTVCTFWSKMDRSGGPESCWKWTGSINPTSGYGEVSQQQAPDGRRTSAHRAAYRLYYACDPGSLHVLHRCDNRKCANPRHLFLGTPKTNILDCWLKNRGAASAPGVDNRHAKLHDDAVRKIREAALPLGKLAQQYGVCLGTISKVRRGEYWRHVT